MNALLYELLDPPEDGVKHVPVFLAFCCNCMRTREVTNARCLECGSEQIDYAKRMR